MSDNQNPKKKNLIVPAGHSLITRREFLSHGLIAGTGVVMAPTFLGMLSSNLYAQSSGLNCSLSPASVGKTPFLCIDLAGGGNIAGSNIIVGKQNGQSDFLSDYVQLGRPTFEAQNDTVNTMGLLWHRNSGILNGIRTTATTEILGKVGGAVACGISGDDTSSNPHNPVYWLSQKVGLSGALIKTAGSTSRSSGGNATVPPESFSATAKPVQVTSRGQATGLAGLGLIAAQLGKSRAQAILRTANNMSVDQLRRFNEMDLPRQIREIASCGYVNSAAMTEQFSEAVLDPAFDPVYAGAGSVFFADEAAFNAGSGQVRRQASLCKVLFDGIAASAVLEMGGYDYHGDTRQNQQRKDFEAGQAIGRALTAAAAKGKDLFIYLFTDGGVSSDNNINQVQNFDAAGNVIGTPYDAGQFVNDAGQTGAIAVFYYNHLAFTETQIIRANNTQVGWFRNNNGRIGVDPTSSVLGDNVTNAAKWVVLNYLALHNPGGSLQRLGEELVKVVGDNPFSDNMAKYVVFNPKS
jgi:hypothetical protein